MKKDSPLHLASVLMIFCAVCAFALAGVNEITAPKIQALQAEKTKQALQNVAEGATDFEKLELRKSDNPMVVEAYTIKNGDKDGGYCVLARPSGFGGPIDVMVGINVEGTILGVKLVSMKETPGIGTKADTPQWLDQFDMKQGAVKLVKSATGAADEIVAISGATVTSDAVTQGVQAALDFAQGRAK